MELMLMSVLFVCLLIHIYTDCKEQLLYDKVSSVLVPAGVVYAYYFGNVWDGLQGALFGAGVMLAIFLLSRGGMGLGDVKLAFVLGIWLGLEQTVLCLLLAFISGGVLGVLLLVTGIKGRKDAIPFGPYLCVSGWVSLLWGEAILLWYWSLW